MTAARTGRTALRPYDWLALGLLSLLLASFAATQIETAPEEGDARQLLAVALHLSHAGVYRERLDDPGYHRREPLLPFLVAGIDRVRGALGLARLPVSCAGPAAAADPACAGLGPGYRLLNIGFLALAAGAAFALAFRLSGARMVAWAAWALTGLSATLLAASHRLLTELPAAALLITVSALWLVAQERRRPAWFAALGLALAALVLTKVIFAWLWLVVLLATLGLAWREGTLDRRLAACCAALLLAYALPTGGWMMRNYLASGHLGLVEKRAYKVLSVRAAYNQMRMDEFWAGFAYFTPALRPADLPRLGIAPASFERFDKANPQEFRQSGQRQYRQRESALGARYGEPQMLQTDHRHHKVPPREVADQIEREMKARILADPLAHLRVSLLLGYRALFPEVGFGYPRAPKAETLGERWPVAWPRWGYAMSGLRRTLYNGAAFLALLLVPLLLWRRGDPGGIILALPALYSHGMYALVSHFIPRYAVPEIPAMTAALAVLAWLALGALRSGAVRLAPPAWPDRLRLRPAA
jgi:hypothetical protein